jgi:hypothetical protein
MAKAVSIVARSFGASPSGGGLLRLGHAPGKDFLPWGSAQPIEKARSRQENPRKSKPFSLIFFAPFSRGFAGFG